MTYDTDEKDYQMAFNYDCKSFEFDFEELRERELAEYRKWLEEKECND